MGQATEAEASVRRALQLNPNHAEAHHRLGLILDRTARSREAEACYRRALDLRPDWTAAQSSLAIALTNQDRLEEAAEVFRRVVALEPASAAALVNLALVLARQGKPTEAEAALRKTLILQPDNGGAYVDLARILRDTNRFTEAEDTLRRAIERFPLMTEARSDLLHSLNFNAERSPQYCLEEARRYGEAVRARVNRAYSSWACTRDPVRLRVGITSGDIHSHPVGFFLEGVLGHLDQGRIELVGYPTGPKADALTERVRSHFAAWRPLNGLPDEAAARQIHGDGVHVLIELSGHTPHNRLPMLAWKPAPVQVSWLGYFATTGVTEIDYFLADETSVPPEHRCHFTESVWYLPDTRLCFTPPDSDVPVSPLPALRAGSITFGSFQGPAKLNDRTLSLWARVMDAVPGARLRIQSRGLASAATREAMIRRLETAGIVAGRVTLHGPASRPAYLAAHAEVDIILDTLPFTGGTTTCEALWMGVPTLTIAGDRLVSLQGASLMRAAGLTEWVADDEDSFVAKAAAFAAEPRRLGELRSGLRQRLPGTPLFDARQFAANLETALWQMWQKWRQGN
jgi:predicted O-linked N-acetylglucosamine transferase (SPINDLY family)